MLFRIFLLPGVIVPIAAAALVVGLLYLLQRKTERFGMGGGVAIAAAFLSTYVAITGWPRFPPLEASQRLFFVVGFIALAGWVINIWRPSALPWTVRALLLAALLGLLLQSQIEHRWSRLEAAAWIAGLLVIGLVFDRALGRGLSIRGQGVAGLVAVGVRLALVGGSALALGLAESARLAQLAGGIACGMLAVEILARLRRRQPWHHSDSTVLTIAVFGLLVIGFFYANLGVLPALLLLTAFILLGLPRASAWSRLLPLVPLAVAVGILIVGALAKEDDPYDYYGSLDIPAVTAS